MSTVPERQHAVKTSRTIAGDGLSAAVIAVFRLHARLVEVGDAMAAPAGQTSARWQVLAAAEDADRSVADIARALGQARQSVLRVADALVADGVAEYRDNPRHRRARLLVLTASGAAALARIQEVQRGWADRIGATVGVDRLERLLDDLRAVQAAIDADGPESGAPDGG